LLDPAAVTDGAFPLEISTVDPVRGTLPHGLPATFVPSDGDAALVQAAWRGDGEARTAIWRKYSGLIRSKMRRAIGERDVEDHVQDVFVGFYENLPQLRDPAALRGFLLGIALRVAGTELRRRSNRWWLTLTLTGDLPDAQTSGDDATDAREILRAFMTVVGRLGPHGGRVFGLRYIENLELKQVAERMNASLATTKRRLYRASARFLAMAQHDPVLSEFLHGRAVRHHAPTAMAYFRAAVVPAISSTA
jgi:RNA polymerase sigma-70 factor (ECF subfamily)